MTRQFRPYVKSSRSGGSGGNCVQWAFTREGVYVRDSKDPDGPELLLTYDEWADVVDQAQRGEIYWSIKHGGQTLAFTTDEWTAFLEAVELGECTASPALAGIADSVR